MYSKRNGISTMHDEINWIHEVLKRDQGQQFRSIYELYGLLKTSIPVCQPEVYERHIRKLQDFLDI